MINERLHRQVAALDSVKHRTLRLDTSLRHTGALRALNAFFIANAEFGDACRELPVVWVHAGRDEQDRGLVAPVAVLGVGGERNLCLDDAGSWRVRYVPAMLRLYPFAMARVDQERLVMCIDESWAGFSREAGEPLFGRDGEPTALTKNVQGELERFEAEVERTRLAGRMLVDRGLLREMRFDATLPDGGKLSVDGFLTVDQAKLDALADADVLALHRAGVLGLIHAHQISLGNMARLVEWHVAAAGSGAAPGARAVGGAP